LPVTDEDARISGFSSDPVGDSLARRSSSLLHKYEGRALLMLAGACAVNCRYCFRREYPYEETLRRGHLEAALAAVAGDPSLEEVILSGGDPLLLSDAAIGGLVERLAAIPHLRRVRVHSRVPVVIPARVTSGLLVALTRTRLSPVMVLHLNHPAELDDEVAQAGHALAAQGILTLNQSVLLAGVNDELGVLRTLSQRLFAARIQPYYLHLLDRVHGSAHFEVDETRARTLYGQLHASLPGYLVPRLVREEPGMSGKTLQLPTDTIIDPLASRTAATSYIYPE
jgi:EF-P beta-lysylation protein EpmB